MTTNIQYNPIFRATRAAFAELTTPAARRWYAQQLQTTAALVSQKLTHVRRWLNASRGQNTVVPVQQGDSTEIEPAHVGAQPETTASGLGGIPAAWAAIEANPTPTATLSEQAIAVADTQATTADLGPEPELLDLAATEQITATDYERLDDSQALLTEADEPLPEVEIPFTDDLESGPPYLSEEDVAFFDPEEDSSDSLIEDDLAQSSSDLPPDLNARLEAYLRVNGISVEPDNACGPHYLPTPSAGYSSTGAEFGE